MSCTPTPIPRLALRVGRATRGRHGQDADYPIEVRSLGRTLIRWKQQIAAWHQAQVSNGPTEAVNNLIKRVKRAAFGFTSFRNYRIRSLLYAGKTQLGPARYHHTPLKSEEPTNPARNSHCRHPVPMTNHPGRPLNARVASIALWAGVPRDHQLAGHNLGDRHRLLGPTTATRSAR